MLLIIIWLLILKISLQLQSQATDKPYTPTINQAFNMLNFLQSISNFSYQNCVIKKLDSYQHEVLIYGQAFSEQSFAQLEKNINSFSFVKQIEVKQWDFIKPGKWRFILGVVY